MPLIAVTLGWAGVGLLRLPRLSGGVAGAGRVFVLVGWFGRCAIILWGLHTFLIIPSFLKSSLLICSGACIDRVYK